MQLELYDYYRIVSSINDVDMLYKLDLLDSMMTINKKCLLYSLTHVIKDHAILDLISQYLNIPILDDRGIDMTSSLGCSIPPIGLLSEVLFNYALNKCDLVCDVSFKPLRYMRYNHEVLITATEDCSYFIKDRHFRNLFENLNLVGKVDIHEHGFKPIHCLGGLLSINKDGHIEIQDVEMNDEMKDDMKEKPK